MSASLPLVGLYIDGAVVSTFNIRNGSLELWDVQQVEVYRGTQSINLGRSSLAGGISIKTKDPTYDWTLDTRTQFASYNTFIASAAGGGSLVEDQLAFRIAFDHQTIDGYVDNPILKTNRSNDDVNTLIRGKLLFEPLALPGFSALASASYSKNREGDDVVARAKGDSRIEGLGRTKAQGGEFNRDPINPFERKLFSNNSTSFDVDSLITTLELKYQLNDDWKIQSVSTYEKDTYDRHEDGNRRPNNTLVGDPNVDDLRIRNNTTITYTEEFRLHYENERIRGQVGAYYYLRDNKDRSLFTLGGISRDQRFRAETESWAVFGKLEFDLADWLTVYGGARYDAETLKLKDRQRFQFFLEGIGLNGEILPVGQGTYIDNLLVDISIKSSFDAFLPQAGMTLTWKDSFSTSFIWKKGYRPGGTDLKIGEPINYDSEFITNYELALHSNWFDDRLQINANFFYSDWEDQQVMVLQREGEFGNLGRTLNAGSSKLYGYEIELFAQPLDGLSIFANFGYSRTKFIDFDTEIDETVGGIDFSGLEFQKAPRLTASVGGTYRHHSGIFLNTEFNYKSGSINSITRQKGEFPNERLPSRTILNMKLGYELEHVAIYACARNLLDDEYITHRNFGPRLGHVLKVGEPRVIGIQLTTNWH